jgi:hypothetical protein
MDTIDRNRQQGQARRLAEALLAQPNDMACSACLDVLEEYVAAQLRGGEQAAVRPDVAAHLDACVACSESYALLYAAHVAEHALAAPASVPAPDLSFLQARAAGPLAPAALRDQRRAARLHQATTAAVTRAGERLRLALSRTLLDLLPPPATPALAFRSGMGAPMFELAIDEPDAAIARLNVSAYAADEAAGRCIVRVQMALRGREWPDLAGVAVTLQARDERLVAATDAWGEAVFEGVPAAALPELIIDVDAGV